MFEDTEKEILYCWSLFVFSDVIEIESLLPWTE